MGSIKDILNHLEGLKREIQDISKIQISVLPDKNGMIDKQCPKQDCLSIFKVNVDDWKNIFRNEEVFCPFCKNNSEAKNYLPIEQVEAVKTDIHKSIMHFWKHRYSTNQYLKSLQSSDEFETHVKCEVCNARYSIIGAAYFCPSCGYNSVERIAKESINKMLSNAKRLTEIKQALEKTFTQDETVIIVKNLIENSLSSCIGTLQNFSEVKYNHLSSVPAPFNTFQNIDKSTKLWFTLKGENYDTWLTHVEKQQLNLYTQRRHLLEHKGGIVDAKYLLNTSDKNYNIGDRIIVTTKDVITLGEIVLKLIICISDLK